MPRRLQQPQPQSSPSPPPPNHNEVLQRFYTTFERIILFFAFDFTIDWKQSLTFFNRQKQQSPATKTDYSKLRKKCIHKPTVPPRTSPRKHIRANVKSFDEPKVEARKKSSVEMVTKISSSSASASAKSKKNSRNLGKIQRSIEEAVEMPRSVAPHVIMEDVEMPKNENVTSDVATMIEETENLHIYENGGNLHIVENDEISRQTANFAVEEENAENLHIDENYEISNPEPNLDIEEEEDESPNPLSMLLQPILDLFSAASNYDNDDEKLDDFENSDETEIDQSTDLNDSYAENDQKPDESMPNPPLSEMDVLEEALNESPEKFIETLIAMNDASKLDISNQNPEKTQLTETLGQQLLAEAGAQLIQQESTVSPQQQNIEYSTQKQEKIGNNFCINRTTTFHLDPPAEFPLKL